MEWKSVCCAVQGRGHAKKNLPCQDKVAHRAEGGVHVIALADGAGSAALSHHGAECVVNRITAFVADKFFDIIAQEDGRLVTQELLSVTLQALNDKAELLNCELKDLASTLLVAAVGGEFSNEAYFVTSAAAIAHIRI